MTGDSHRHFVWGSHMYIHWYIVYDRSDTDPMYMTDDSDTMYMTGDNHLYTVYDRWQL